MPSVDVTGGGRSSAMRSALRWKVLEKVYSLGLAFPMTFAIWNTLARGRFGPVIANGSFTSTPDLATGLAHVRFRPIYAVRPAAIFSMFQFPAKSSETSTTSPHFSQLHGGALAV